MNQFKAIWGYRYFIMSSIMTEFKSRFARSKLGGIWMIIHPLAQVAIYALVLSAVLSAKLPGIESHYAYAIYLMAGILSWNLFSEVFIRCLTMFVDNGNLLKKMSFPKIALPIIIVGSGLVNNILLFLAIIFVFGLLGHTITVAIVYLPIVVFITLLLALGLGLMLGVLNVFIRDIGQMMPIILQFWFWLTPIVYIASIIPEKYSVWMQFNPMYGIATAYQSILVYGESPLLSTLIYPICLALLALGTALWIYYKANEEMADVL